MLALPNVSLLSSCAVEGLIAAGMTSLAVQAQTLHRLLGTRHGRQDGLWKQFFKQVAKVVDIPWHLAVGEDFRYAETVGQGPPGTRLSNAYVKNVHRATHHDTVVYGQFLRVMNLMAAPAGLFRPSILWRVLRGPASNPPLPSRRLAVENQV